MKENKRTNSETKKQAMENYKKARKEMKDAFKNSKKKRCEEVDNNVWGKCYQIVMKSKYGTLGGNEEGGNEGGGGKAFPQHEKVEWERKFDKWKVLPVVQQAKQFMKEELARATKRIRLGKAPGLDEIPRGRMFECDEGVLKARSFSWCVEGEQASDDWERSKSRFS